MYLVCKYNYSVAELMTLSQYNVNIVLISELASALWQVATLTHRCSEFLSACLVLRERVPSETAKIQPEVRKANSHIRSAILVSRQSTCRESY